MQPTDILPSSSSSGASDPDATEILRDFDKIPYLEAAIVLAGGFAANAAIKWIFPWLASKLPDRLRFYVLPWEPILRLLIVLTVVVYVVPLIVNPTPQNLLAIAGGAALALGFAFKDYISSIVAGIVALYERPYRVGDWVTIHNVYGEVQSLNLRTVELLTPDDTLVAVPHNRIWQNPIGSANSGSRELMCVANFYLHPRHDGQHARQILADVAWTSCYLHTARPVLVIAFEKPWGTEYRLEAYPIDGRQQFQFLTDLTLRGKAALEAAGYQSVVVPAAAAQDDRQMGRAVPDSWAQPIE